MRKLGISMMVFSVWMMLATILNQLHNPARDFLVLAILSAANLLFGLLFYNLAEETP